MGGEPPAEARQTEQETPSKGPDIPPRAALSPDPGLETGNPVLLTPPPNSERDRRLSLSPRSDRRRTRTSKRASSCGVFAYLDYSANRQHSSPSPDASPSTAPGAAESPSEDVVMYFHQVDHHLLTKTIVGDRLAYNHCPKVRRVGVHGMLDKERKGLYAGKLTLKEQKDFEKRVSLFNSADIIFKFFFSPDANVPTVRRFWGAVEELVKVCCGEPLHAHALHDQIESDIKTTTRNPHQNHQTLNNIGLWSRKTALLISTMPTHRHRPTD
jgi:hypothetical protein